LCACVLRFGLERTHLTDRARERLLAVDVLPHLERHHRRGTVHVVRRRDGHRVDVVGLLLQHLAEILVAPHRRPGPEGALGRAPVDVSEGDELLVGHPAHVVEAHPADADAGDAEFLVRLHRHVGQRVKGARHRGHGTRGGHPADETTTIEWGHQELRVSGPRTRRRPWPRR